MFNTLLFIHLVISILLIVIILLQKTSTDGLSGIGGGSSNMGLVSGRTAANFMTKATIFLAVVFFVNAIILANISSKSQDNISKKLETEQSSKTELDQIPTGQAKTQDAENAYDKLVSEDNESKSDEESETEELESIESAGPGDDTSGN